MDRTKQLRRRLRNRIGSRGAAMVEGIIVISVMLTFLGLITWTRHAYWTKLDLQQKTRSDALFYASSGCKNKGGGNSNSAPGGVAGATPSTGLANRMGGDAASVASQSWGKVTAIENRTVLGFYSVNPVPAGNINYVKWPFKSDVNASSYLICNEPKYGNVLVAAIQFAIQMGRTGGGIGSLF